MSSVFARAAVLVLLLSACGGSDAQSGPQTPPPDGLRLTDPAPAPAPDGERSVRARVLRIAAGEQHTVAVMDDGSVWTWGLGGNGQLGRTATEDDYWRPTPVPGVTGRWVAAGGSTTFVYDGENLWTAGYNSQGYLGYGPTGDEQTFTSRPFPGLLAVEGFGSNYLALHADSTVWAWGEASSGQLGNGTTPSRPQVEPLQVRRLLSVKAIATGGGFNLALRDDGTVWAWGLNNSGTLGNASVPSYARSVHTTTSASGSASASSGGGGNRTFSATPVQAEIEEVIAIAAGDNHALAVRADSTVWGWGQNERGALGLNGADGYVLTPTRLNDLTGVVAVEAGSGFSLALKADGSLWMWGVIDGMNGYNEPYGRARRVPGLPAIVAIEAGQRHAFAVSEDGRVWGWGLSDMGQVGAEASEGATDWPPLPVRFNR